MSKSVPPPGKGRPSVPFRPPVQNNAKFPAAWSWWVDQSIPQYVKDTYSPKASWKGKPFSQEDARFFLKGINELSELFTEERPRDLPSYFSHPKYRSAYLLYFLPLQAAKMATIYAMHPKAIGAAIKHATRTGTLKVLDLGAGPGTASLALLLTLIDEVDEKVERLPKLEFHWYDTQEGIMRDGVGLAKLIADRFPGLHDKLKIVTHSRPWWDVFTPRGEKEAGKDFSLVLSGHVLNEFPWHDSARAHRVRQTIEYGLRQRGGGGFLYVEPAFKHASQLLSQLRDSWFENGVLPAEPSALWGPCLHGKTCPLAVGRDWCHFSVRADLPGTWFKFFSRGLGSERQWLKFSYVWVASEESPNDRVVPASYRRVVSDQLKLPSGDNGILLCEPEHPLKEVLHDGEHFFRGDLIDLERRGNRQVDGHRFAPREGVENRLPVITPRNPGAPRETSRPAGKIRFSESPRRNDRDASENKPRAPWKLNDRSEKPAGPTARAAGRRDENSQKPSSSPIRAAWKRGDHPPELRPGPKKRGK